MNRPYGQNGMGLVFFGKIANMEPCAAYREALAAFLGVSPEQISLFWKGRVGLYNLLEALGVGAGDEVIVPAFTCVVVPNAILYRGAKVVFVDIDQRTLSIKPELILPKITAKTKVLLAQNTLGLPSDLPHLRAVADRHRLFLIDDATHGLHSDPESLKLVDAAFYSTQWNKPYSTGLGGMTYVRDPELAAKVRRQEQLLRPPGFQEVQFLRAQYWARARLLKPAFYWPMLRLFRWMSEKNWVVGSSQGEELSSARMPEGYNKGMSARQCKWGCRGLAALPDLLKHRRQIAAIYDAGMQQMGFAPVFQPDYAAHGFLKYPFFVRNRPAFMRLAMDAHVPLGDWMLSPIHPILQDFERWTYPYGENPVGESLSRAILNLPTEVSALEAGRILRFLEQHRDQMVRVEELLG